MKIVLGIKCTLGAHYLISRGGGGAGICWGKKLHPPDD